MANSGRLALLDHLASSQQDAVAVQMRDTPVLFLNTPALIKEFLIEHADSFEKSNFQMSVIGMGERQTYNGLGNGLLTSSNEVHRDQQRLLGAAFDQRRLQRYAGQMAGAAAQLCQSWPVGERLEISDLMMSLSTRILGETLFSTHFGMELPAVAAAMHTITTRLGRSARERDSQMDDLSSFTDATTVVRRAAARLIEHHQQHPDEERDVIDLLLSVLRPEGEQTPGRYSVTMTQLVDDLLTLLFAGSENPKNALSWTFYLLGHHPEVYDQLQAEVRTTLEGRDPTYADLARLPYTLAVYKEALRLYPPGYAFGRRALRGCQIGSWSVEVGTEVVVSPYALHRREDYFPEPTRFRPERFLVEDAYTRAAFLPFGAGPRSCIGGQFSLVEGQVVLATLAQRLRLELDPPDQVITPEPRITLRPAPGVWMKRVAPNLPAS